MNELINHKSKAFITFTCSTVLVQAVVVLSSLTILALLEASSSWTKLHSFRHVVSSYSLLAIS